MSAAAHFPLESFLLLLAEKGVVVDTRARIRLQIVLEEFGKGFALKAEDVGLYIAPIVAHTPEEQALVLELWREFLARPQVLTEVKQEKVNEKTKEKTKFNYWVYSGIGVLVAFILLLIYVYASPLQLPDFEVKNYSDIPQPTPGDTVSFRARIEGEIDDLDIAWQVDSLPFPGTDTMITLAFDKSGNHFVNFSLSKSRLWRTVSRDTTLEFPIECKGKPHFNFIDIPDSLAHNHKLELQLESYLDTVQNLRFDWDFGDSSKAEGRHVPHLYDSVGEYYITLTITDPRYPDCPQTLTTFHRVGEDTTEKIAAWPPWPELPAEPTWVREINWTWVWLVAAGLVIFIILLHEVLNRRRRRRKAALVAQFQSDHDGPYHIPWPDADGLIRWDETLDRVAALMAGRSTSTRVRLDMRATLRATLASAGLPSLRFRGHSRPTAWLVLVDEEGLTTHERRLMDWLIARLLDESVLLDTYYFRGQPDRVWERDSTHAIPLSTLQTRYPDHRLVVISRGQGLLHPLRAELHPRLRERLGAWTFRTLLTPEHPAHWGGRERALAEHFGICPVDAKAIQAYLLLTELPEAGRFHHWRKQLMQLLPPPLSPPQWPQRPVNLDALQAASGGGFIGEWAAALHSYPELVYELSLTMGAALKSHATAGKDANLRWDELWQLLRTPFMREERQLRPLRKEAAEAGDRPFLRRARLATSAALESALATLVARGLRGMAHTKSLRELTLQRFALAPKGKGEQAAARALIDSGLAVAGTPELKQLPPEKSPRRWRLLGWIVWPMIVFWTLVGTLHFYLPEIGVLTPLGKFIDGIGIRQTEPQLRPADYIDLIASSGRTYKFAQKAYEAQSYEEAKDSLNDVLGGFYTSSIVIKEDTLFTTRLPLYRALLDNAMGLCQYYLGNYDLARNSLDTILQFRPNFYEKTAVELPNLQSLLNKRRLVQGRVLDEKGQGLNGALLVVKPSDITLGLDSVYSDVKGNFELAVRERAADAKPDSLIVSLPGFVTWRGLVTSGKNQLIRLETAACNPYYDLACQLKAADGTQLSGARLRGPGLSKGVKTKAGYTIRLCDQQAGDKVTLSYSADGYQQHDTMIQLGQRYTNEPLSFNTRSKVELKLWKELETTVLDGRVLDETGDAIPQFTVRIGDEIAPIQTDYLSGRFTVKWPPSKLKRLGKTHLVTIESSGWAASSERLTLPARDQVFILKANSLGGSKPLNWEINAFHYFEKVRRPVPEFEVFVEGKSVGKGKDGVASIPVALLPRQEGLNIRISAAGFKDYTPYIQDLKTKDFGMSLAPEVQKLVEDMVYVQGGEFMMGAEKETISEYEKKAQKVKITGFRIGRYEITQAQWMTLMESNPSLNPNCAQCPVENIEWADCQKFVQKLSSITGENFDLPTEVQWEYAAKGGAQSKGYKYAGGNDLENIAWYEDNSSKSTQAVGGKRANELGLFDMSGNASEWCRESYRPVTDGKLEDLEGFPLSSQADGYHIVLRGGSWKGKAWTCLITSRHTALSGIKYSDVGFRIVRY